MKTYKTVEYPARTEEVVDKRICDLCGAEGRDNWDAGIYEVNETEVTITVKQKEGSSYPEGGSGTEYEVDICPKCFITKLIVWLRSQGVNIEREQWEWDW